MDPDELLVLMKARRSIRAFKPDPVPEGAITKILEAARWCQSASNKQPWRFIVVEGKEVIKALGKCATYGNFIDQAPVVIAFVADSGVAPKWHVHDSSMCSHQACLMAWALGLGTCWIGSMDRDKAAALLGLGRDEVVATILPIGFPASVPKPTSRKALDDLVSYK
ncbi:MAG: nitroreductase family protein [Candidatus Lokiarchaeota archaeon]|nr:nitroreductase family protein [Candidatus Lokiarchaeota archaeon]